MTTAAKHSSDRTGCQQHWRRTVYYRQGRFFIICVTVRSKRDLPLRTAFPRIYTVGRFTVKEELQWLSHVASPKAVAGDQSSVPMHVVHRGRQHFKASPQKQQQLCSVHSPDTKATQAQQQQQHERQACSLQSVSPAHVRVSVGCLQFGSSWGASLRKALRRMARAFRRTAGQIPAATLSAEPNLGVGGGPHVKKPAAVSGAAVPMGVTAASGTGVHAKGGLARAKPGSVLVSVLGYSWGSEVVALDAPA